MRYMKRAENDEPMYVHASEGNNSALDVDVSDLIGIVVRGWRIVLLGLLAGVMGAVVISSLFPASYKATARILIDNSLTRMLYSNKVGEEPTLDLASAASQIYVITSESVLRSVVQSLKLAEDEDFVVPEAKKKTLMTIIGGFFRSEQPGIDAAIPPEQRILDELQRQLDVIRADVPNVIDVTFSSRNPAKAANIANAIAESYLASTLENRVNSSKIANRLMQERLTELKQKAADAERTLQEYKVANNLFTSDKGPLSTDQLKVLNNHLTEARVAMANAKARLDRVHNSPEAVGRNELAQDNEIILRLRTQYLDYATRATEIEARAGKEHLAAVKMRSRMVELQAAIADEQQRIVKKLSVDYELAKARYEEIASTLTSVAGEEGSNSRAQARMRELESSAETLRSLHNAILQRYSETAKLDDKPANLQEARILAKASPPARKESSKKRLAFMGGTLVLGLLLGLGGAIAFEYPFGVYRTADQVLRDTGFYCAVLPDVRLSKKTGRALNEHVLNAPYSRFTETLRNVWALIAAAKRDDGAKVIGILSSVAKEGKTTVACNLATLLAATSKLRVLVIDGDFHRRSLTAGMAPDAQRGIFDAIEDPEHLTDYVTKMERSGLHVLPCVLSDRVPNAADVLGSNEMEHLLAVARDRYDIVILEIAPVVSVVDIKMVERFVDKFVFVVEWGRTQRRLLHEALGEVPAIHERILCVVLNKASSGALKNIERYKGKTYGAYYQA